MVSEIPEASTGISASILSVSSFSSKAFPLSLLLSSPAPPLQQHQIKKTITQPELKGPGERQPMQLKCFETQKLKLQVTDK